MVAKARTQCISLLMLFIIALGSTASAIGEFRSHNLTAASIVTSDHSHSFPHSHTVDVDVDGDYSLHHDASNHNHMYDKATPRALNHTFFSKATGDRFARQVSGTPIRKPFLLERPPRTLLSI